MIKKILILVLIGIFSISISAKAIETREKSNLQNTYTKTLPQENKIVTEIEVEFPEATYVWNYLHELEYSDVIAASILGNIMVECGGYTLDLQTSLTTNGYYGICQWSSYYYPDVIDCSLEEQCDFLRDTIQYEIDTFGYKYKEGFNYNSFLEITDIKEASLAFAKSYERCTSASYEFRQNCAEIAFEYFLG